ncbi:MAG: permease, partial [Candidatus Methylomirabilis sp.]|nr:permease [Deltaproteobacteria bacterium]
MAAVMGFVLEVLQNSLIIFNEAALYLLAGVLVAAVLHEFLSTDLIARYAGERSFKSVVMGAVLGAPLPLCSCGVVPTVVALKKKGARREGLISFLISTPETDVDAMAITYALLGPVMTVFRPLTGIVTSLVAGAALMVSAEDEQREPSEAELDDLLHRFEEEEAGHGHGREGEDSCCEHAHEAAAPEPAPAGGVRGLLGGLAARLAAPLDPGRRTGRILRFAGGDLIDDLALWLVVGILFAGFITT